MQIVRENAIYMRNVCLIASGGRDRNCGGTAISTDERACVLIRMLRPAVRGGTGRFCSHARIARGNIRESKSRTRSVSRPGEKWLLYEDPLPVFILICCAIQFARVLTYDFRRSIRRQFQRCPGRVADRDTTTKISVILSHISRFSNTRTRLHSVAVRTLSLPFIAFFFFFMIVILCFIPWISNLILLSSSRVLTWMVHSCMEYCYRNNSRKKCLKLTFKFKSQ